MSSQPPPSPGMSPPPPHGYNPYGAVAGPQKTNGLSIASLVLGICGAVLFCLWAFQIPGLLAVIFGVIGRKQINASNGAQKGKGLATAGLILGIIMLVVCAAFWAYIAFSGDCTLDGGQLTCSN